MLKFISLVRLNFNTTPMKFHTTAYIILLLLFTKSLSAQDYERDKRFINEVFKIESKIVVLDHLPTNGIQGLSYDLNHDTVRNMGGNTSADLTLVLTKSERKYIRKQLREMNKPYLKADLFDTTIIISQSQLDKIFKGNFHGWPDFQKDYNCQGYYSFSKPIFLRGDNLCIFYHHYSCGLLCGNDDLAIYKKVGNKWQYWLQLDGGVN